MSIFDFLKSRPPGPRLRSLTDQDVRSRSATSVDSGQNSGQGAVSGSVKPAEDWGAVLCDAAETGDVITVRTLLERGASANYRAGPKRATALILAAQKGQDDVIQMLVARGAEIDAQNTDGVTAVFLAALNGHVSSTRLLARHGARLDLKTNKEGWTPLMGAVVNNHSEAVRALLELGADSRVRNSLGKTAEEMAAEHPKIAALFAAHGQRAPRAEDAREARFRALQVHGKAVHF
jgi:ankyrin repeat protein